MSNTDKLLWDFKGQRDHQGLRCPEVFWEKVGFKQGIEGDKI